MQQSFEINADQNIPKRIITELTKFGHRRVRIIIEDMPLETVPKDQDQYRLFLQSEQLQKEYPPMPVSPSVDLSALANEVNL